LATGNDHGSSQLAIACRDRVIHGQGVKLAVQNRQPPQPLGAEGLLTGDKDTEMQRSAASSHRRHLRGAAATSRALGRPATVIVISSPAQCRELDPTDVAGSVDVGGVEFTAHTTLHLPRIKRLATG
jgi:hypothetical protein